MSELNSKVGGRVWCRDCGKEMIPYDKAITIFSCKNCKLQARIHYKEMPLIKISQKEMLEEERSRL